MTPVGSTTEPQLIPIFGGPLLGAPVHNWSTMSNAILTGEQTGNKILVGGDFKAAVVIGDRLGMSVEVIQNALDATTGYPTGQRILFAYWRSGCVVRDVNKLRYLEIS
jgi:HK97 family phage major capsid protein